jgi:tRNA pseudouridine38-40 synthase
MRNIKLTIQYDGTNYHGWQIQPIQGSEFGVRSLKHKEQKKNVITVQGILQETIKEITGEDTKVIGAGRTDAGVHAIEQVASFKTSTGLPPDIIKRALNAILPDDIRIIGVHDAESTFHPRYDAKSKIYFYVISTDRTISPFLNRYIWKIPYKLNLDEMDVAIKFLKGKHDFAAFRASGCGAKSTVRTIFNISLEVLNVINFMTAGLNGNFLKIRIEADAFLRHMARNIVGTIIEVGKGKISKEDIKKILASKDRRFAGPAAPTKGLFLEKINYCSSFFIFSINSLFS